jgi:hypothetical protein
MSSSIAIKEQEQNIPRAWNSNASRWKMPASTRAWGRGISPNSAEKDLFVIKAPAVRLVYYGNIGTDAGSGRSFQSAQFRPRTTPFAVSFSAMMLESLVNPPHAR